MGRKVNAKETCELFEAFYFKKNGVDFDKMSTEEIDELELFPDEWYSEEFAYNYPLKVETLAKAIKEDKKIAETDYFKENMMDKAPSLRKIGKGKR